VLSLLSAQAFSLRPRAPLTGRPSRPPFRPDLRPALHRRPGPQAAQPPASASASSSWPTPSQPPRLRPSWLLVGLSPSRFRFRRW